MCSNDNLPSGFRRRKAVAESAQTLPLPVVIGARRSHAIGHMRVRAGNIARQMPVICLSIIEKQILSWAAAGKTDDDIGTILRISKHTVNMHFRRIYRKLSANNRVLAVVKALACGLINLTIAM